MNLERDARLQTFIVQLGAAMNATGQPVDVVQERLRTAASAAGARDARITAFPTSIMVSLDRGGTAALELTTSLASVPRLDQIAAIDRLSHEAAGGAVTPADGLSRLDEVRRLPRRFGAFATIGGYSLLTVGICQVLRPSLDEVVWLAVALITSKRFRDSQLEASHRGHTTDALMRPLRVCIPLHGPIAN